MVELIFEGAWEEASQYAAKFAGRRFRLEVLDEVPSTTTDVPHGTTLSENENMKEDDRKRSERK